MFTHENVLWRPFDDSSPAETGYYALLARRGGSGALAPTQRVVMPQPSGAFPGLALLAVLFIG